MGRRPKVPVREELDFAYLLELMPPLHNVPEYACLPELFSIIGHESLLTLCKYAGGEIIKIPTIDEISISIEALQWFYNVYIKKTHSEEDVPDRVRSLYDIVVEVYDERCLTESQLP